MEPDVAEFVSALDAGSGARLIVEACAGSAGPTALALAAAAQQTAGRVVCILPNLHYEAENVIEMSSQFLGAEADQVEIVMGDASKLLADEYKGADFVLVYCGLEKQERLFKVAVASVEECGGGGIVVGYNAFGCDKSSWNGNLRVDLLPIGGGLRVCRVPARARRSRWVVRMDGCTGEEHVYRITSQPRRGNYGLQ